MNKLVAVASLLLLSAAAPAMSQGVQMPNAPNATEPQSLNSPPLTSLSQGSQAPRAGKARRPRPRRHRRPAPTG